MTVEEVCNYDNFPVGMRVLAVDDDPICLKLLETLLRKCQYNVTTTSEAREALRMLRENRDRFDLVISDVHMPDMDGFKLLELLGLEMDLPVIMLSVNSDPKLVMKGVTHGACDYLVKPVRIEELRNIWQHVIRKKKVDPKAQSGLSGGFNDKALQGSGEGGVAPCPTGSGDQTGKLNKKRKDEEDDGSDNGDEEEPGTQKKPRVVWSIELHRKFVNAVHQLGIEKAVPKRILDLMNVDGLTRENVASHLQKYRLYLKRISSSEAQQANMVAALGGKEAAFMRLSTLDGLGEFRSLAGPGRLAGPTYSPFSQSGMLGRLNSPGGINLGNHLTSSPLVRPSQNVSNPGNIIGKLHQGISPASQNSTAFQGIPSSLEFDQLQQNKCTSRVEDFSSLDDSRMFGGAGTFAISSNNMLSGASNNAMGLQGNSPQTLNSGVFVDHSSVGLSSFHSEPFDRNAALHLSNFHLNGLSPTDSFSQGQLPLNGRDNHLLRPQLHNRLPSFSSTASSGGLEDSRGENQCPDVLITGGTVQNMNQVSGTVQNMNQVSGTVQNMNQVSGTVQNMTQVSGNSWNDPKPNFSQNNMFGNFNSQAAPNGVASSLSQRMGQNAISDSRIDVRSSIGPTPTYLQQSEVNNANPRMGAGEEFFLDQIKPQAGFPPNSYEAFDDLMSSMIKREQDGNMFEGGDVPGFDAYQFSSCI